MTEPPSEEQALAARLAAGQEAAFAALYDRLGAALFRAALVITGSREEAEDAVQELFVNLVRSRKRLPEVRSLRGYAFASLRRIAARRASATASIRNVSHRAAERPPRTGIGVSPERGARLERALAALPAGQREVLTLKVDGGLTFAEIAEALEISSNTAASRYRYALERLRALMEEA